MRAFSAILKSESKLVLRGMDTVFFGVLMPIVVAVILGFINGNKPAFEGANYTFMQQSFGALASIGICATGLMGFPLTIADYRHKKILKRYHVTPVSPGMILFVQCVINLILSLISLILVYAVCALFFKYTMAGFFGTFLLFFMLVLLAIYGIGMMLASVSPNIKTANLLCTLIYFPMLLFSGATIPYEVMPVAAQKVMDLLPLTQGIKLLKSTSLGLPLDNVIVPIIVMVTFSVVCIVVSIKFFKWE